MAIEGDYLWQSNNGAELDSMTQNQKEPPYAIPLIDKTPSAEWGSAFNLGYVFPSHRYDLQVSYNFLRLDERETGTVPVAVNASNFTSPIGAHADLKYKFDGGDILLGTYFSPTERWLFRVGYGLGFVRIDQRSTSIFDNRGSDLGYPYTTHVNDTYSKNGFVGLGPKATLSNDFFIVNDIYFVGELGLSVLYGKSKSEVNITGLIINDRPQNSQQNFKKDNYQAALGFEGKIGLAYAAEYSEDIAYSLEGGFKGQSYVNALQDENIHVDLATSGNSSILDFEGTYSNFGPYVNLTLSFM